MAQVSNLTNLYAELNKHGQNQDYERALKIANKSNVYYSFYHHHKNICSLMRKTSVGRVAQPAAICSFGLGPNGTELLPRFCSLH